MMTLLRLPHRQRGDCILYWCFVEILAGAADCDEGHRVQFASNTTEVPGTTEWQSLSFADCVVCTTFHHLVLEIAEAWFRGRSTAFGVVVFCITTDEHPQSMAQGTEGCWNLAAKASGHEHLCWRVRKTWYGGVTVVQKCKIGISADNLCFGEHALQSLHKPYGMAIALRKSGTGSGGFYAPSSSEVEKFLASKRHVTDAISTGIHDGCRCSLHVQQ